MPSKEPSLVCSNQLILNAVSIHDFLHHLSLDGESPHSINVLLTDLELVGFPLKLDGVISNLPIRLPTKCDVEECTKL